MAVLDPVLMQHVQQRLAEHELEIGLRHIYAAAHRYELMGDHEKARLLRQGAMHMQGRQ